MKPARRLKGHGASVTCCVASSLRPGFVASSGEDGCVCCYDLRCKDVLSTINVGEEAASSLCFRAGNEDVIYVSSGTKISCFDIKMASSWKPLETYNYNKDEINQITVSPKSNFLAAADDSGDVKIIDTFHRTMYKTLRSVHTNNYIDLQQRTVCFLEALDSVSMIHLAAITGGLDLKVAIWDFSKGRAFKIIDYGISELDGNGSVGNPGQCVNPAFIHSIAVPEVDTLPGQKKIIAVARGDGVVDVIDLETELASMKSQVSRKTNGSTSKSKRDAAPSTSEDQKKRVQLDYNMGGHTSGVSCVSFSMFPERGKFIISGGNDACVKLWDWSNCFNPEEASCSHLKLTIDINKKVNWICSTPTDTENLVVCDTSKVLKVYTVS